MSLKARVLKLTSDISKITKSLRFHFIDKNSVTGSMAQDESNIYVYLDI